MIEARHRKARPFMLRLGAGVVVPALIATGAYVALRDDTPPPRTVTETPDRDTSLTARNPTGPTQDTTPSPSPSPTGPSEQPRGTTSSDPTAPPDDPSETSPPGDDAPTSPPGDPSTPPDDDPTASPPPVPPRKLTEAEADLWREINGTRERHRCAALKVNSSLTAAARARSADPDGAPAADRAAQAGYDGEVAENATQGPTNARTTMVLLRLDGIETNLRNCEFDVVGIGLDDSGGAYWTVLFGAS